MNFNEREDALAILRDAAEKLLAIGVLARIERAESRNGSSNGAALIIANDLNGIAAISAMLEEGEGVAHGCDEVRAAELESKANWKSEDLVFRAGVFGVQLSESEQANLDRLAGNV